MTPVDVVIISKTYINLSGARIFLVRSGKSNPMRFFCIFFFCSNLLFGQVNTLPEPLHHYKLDANTKDSQPESLDGEAYGIPDSLRI